MDDTGNLSQYNYYGSDLTLPDDVAFMFPWSFTLVVIFLSGLIVYIGICSKIPEELYRRLALQHLASGFIQVTCLTIYNLKFNMEFVNEMLDDAYGSLDLVITFTTACLAWVVFLRVFLFRNGEELYSLKQLTIFSTMSIAIIEAYEWLMSLVETSSSLLPALRLTSVLMIMSLPVVVFMLLVKSLLSSSSDVPKFQALFFMAYLLMFIASDVLLLRFNLHSETSFMLLWSIFLYLRLVFEIVLYILFDRYLSHFFLN